MLRELALQSLAHDEVLVRIEATSLCATDVSAWKGGYTETLPLVLGHEACGTIVLAGENVADSRLGERVVLTYGQCGTCKSCQDHAPAYCRYSPVFNIRAQRVDGTSPWPVAGGHFFAQSSLATYAVARAANAVAIPDSDLPSSHLAPLGCGALTGFGAAQTLIEQHTAGGTSDRYAAVLGCGAVGLSAIARFRQLGIPVLALESRPERATLAKAMGASEVATSLDGWTRRPKWLVDTTGDPALLHEALHKSASRATLLCLASHANTTWHFAPQDLIYSGRTVRGSVEGDVDPHTIIPAIARSMADGDFDIEPLLTHYAFGDANLALQDLRDGKVIKPVLQPELAPELAPAPKENNDAT